MPIASLTQLDRQTLHAQHVCHMITTQNLRMSQTRKDEVAELQATIDELSLKHWHYNCSKAATAAMHPSRHLKRGLKNTTGGEHVTALSQMRSAHSIFGSLQPHF